MTIMETLSETPTQRVDELIESHHHIRFFSTTGTRAAVEELIERNEGLEQAVRELAVELQRLSVGVEQPTDF